MCWRRYLTAPFADTFTYWIPPPAQRSRRSEWTDRLINFAAWNSFSGMQGSSGIMELAILFFICSFLGFIFFSFFFPLLFVWGGGGDSNLRNFKNIFANFINFPLYYY